MSWLGEDGPVDVAFFIVTYPGISMYLCLLQMANGVWGIVRAQDGENKNSNGNRNVPIYQLSLGFQWINVLILQDIVQIAYLPAGMLAPVAPFLACWSLGLTLMPAYLDHKMATLPEAFPEDYYYYGAGAGAGAIIAISDVEHSSSSEDEHIFRIPPPLMMEEVSGMPKMPGTQPKTMSKTNAAKEENCRYRLVLVTRQK